MTILVTNDDGILAEGLRVLANELKKIAHVVVVAPDREQSAIGTAVTLRQPLRVHRVRPVVPEVDTYSVEGTPSDCVILALSTLVEDKIGMVISGINQGANLGDDVFISGTVAAALQGYFRGLHALAISVEAVSSHYLDTAAGLATLLVKWLDSSAVANNVFLNVNLPDLPLAEIREIKVTRLASQTHIDTAREGNDGKGKYYWLVRHRADKSTDNQTDMWAIGQGYISITPLHVDLFNRSAPVISGNLSSDLLQGLRQNQG
ncbi:5'/3'-nucleotidase SurE [subsurface metagenome]